MRKILGILSLPLAMAMTGVAGVACDNVDEYVAPQPYVIDWDAAADSATNALISYYWNDALGFFNEKSGITQQNGHAYWPQAHAMDVIIDAYERTGDTKYSDMFGKWYDGIKYMNNAGNNNNTYYTDFNDDECWVALTMARLYKVTKEDKYLNAAKDLYNDIKGQWNDYGNGGICWKKSSPMAKNSCINGPGSVLAFKMYELTGDEAYAEFGLQVYDWLRENLFNPATGAVPDNLNAETGEITDWNFSYNQGTVMAAALAAYHYTGNALYLKDARRACYFGINSSKFIDSSTNVMLKENGGTPDEGDGGLFRAVFFHYFCDILESSDFDAAWHTKFAACMNASSDYLWRHGVQDKRFILFSSNWSDGVAVGSTGNLNPQITACAVIEMRARFERFQHGQ